MQTFTITDLSFTYPTESVPALQNVSLSIEAGSFTVLCGRSGCGKSTLLRQLKPILQPHGTQTGTILFEGKSLSSLSQREQSARIGGGAAWYFKIYRPKHQQADQPEEDDGGEYPDYDEFEDDGPPWDEEDETEEKEEIR